MDKMEVFQKRIAACGIDMILIGSVCMFLHVPVYWMNGMIFGGSMVILSFFSSLLFLVSGLVMLARDGPTWFIGPLQGQSPGKKALGLLPTKLDGRTNITWEDSIKRNIPFFLPYLISILCHVFRMIPFISGFLLLIAMFGFLVSFAIIGLEILLMYKDENGRRWGDKFADTVVVPYE